MVASGAETRSLVDELQALAPESLESLDEVGNPIGDMVEAGPPALEEPAHGRVRAQWFQELQAANEEDTDPLVLDLFDRGTGVAGDELVQRARLFQGGNGHGNVVKRIIEHVFYGALVRTNWTPEDA